MIPIPTFAGNFIPSIPFVYEQQLQKKVKLNQTNPNHEKLKTQMLQLLQRQKSTSDHLTPMQRSDQRLIKPPFTLPDIQNFDQIQKFQRLQQVLNSKPVSRCDLSFDDPLFQILNENFSKSQQRCLQNEFQKKELIIKSLYSDLPYQSEACKVSFSSKKKLQEHYDWHFQKKSKQYEKSQSRTRVEPVNRNLFSNVYNFLYFEQKNQNQNQEKKIDEKIHYLKIQNSSSKETCFLCQKNLNLFFNQEESSWVFENAVEVLLEETQKQHKMHYTCYQIAEDQQK